jgi:hypothetical protein
LNIIEIKVIIIKNYINGEIMKVISLVLLCFLTASCAVPIVRRSHAVKKEMSKSYKVGVKNSVSTGSSLINIKRLEFEEIDSYVSLKDISSGYPQFPIRRGDNFEVFGMLPDGTPVITSPNFNNGIYGIAITNEGKINSKKVFKDGSVKKKDGEVVLEKGNRGWYSLMANVKLLANHKWENGKLFKKVLKKKPTENSFMCEIIYSGNSGNNINLTYREFTNSLIRAAFSQNLTYNLKKNKVISFKSIKIKVEKFNNSELVFTVVDDGGLPWLPGGKM